MFFSVGTLVIYSFGLFVPEFSREFGWNRIEISLALTVFNLGVVVAAPIYGMLIDRIGARKVILVSILVFAPGYACIALLDGALLQLYITFFAFAILGGGTLPVSYSRIVIGWFKKSRGLALGLSLSGVGIGAAILPPLTQLIIDAYGWRFAVLTLAASILVIAFPVTFLLLKENPSTPLLEMRSPNKESMKDAVNDRTFQVLLFFSLASGVFLIGTLSHFVPILIDRGLSAQTATAYASVMGVAVILGRVGIGAAVDRFFAPRVIFLFYLAPLTALVILRFSDSHLVLLFSAAAFGSALGAEIDVIAYMVSRYFGWQRFGSIYGIMFSCFTFGAGLGPLFMGYIFESTGGYEIALMVMAAITAVTAGSTFLLSKFRF